MNTRRALGIGGLLTLAAALYSAWMWPKLPDIVPTHWNLQGQPDAYGSKLTSVLMMFGFMVLMNALMVALPRMSPDKFKIESFRGTFNYIMVLAIGLFGALHVVILQATADGSFKMERVMLALLFAFFALIGNVMGKVQRNFWMGVRTPWTLADERVWDLTHRSAARLWTVVGAIGVVLSLLGVAPPALFVLIIAMALWPILQSYLIYQRLNSNGTAA